MEKIAIEQISVSNPSTVVVCGHYQVVWCPLRKQLIPVLRAEQPPHPELPVPPAYNTLLQARGSFPEETLRLGAALCRQGGARLLVVVDDVYFTRIHHGETIQGEELGLARKELLSQGLPRSYRSILDGIELFRDERHDPPLDIFSENRFNRQFSATKSAQLLIECRAEDCTCSDTALQLFITIGLANCRQAVLYLPIECARQVEMALSLVIPTLFDEVIGVWGQLDEGGLLQFSAYRFIP